MLNHPTLDQLKTMRLHGMAQAFEEQLHHSNAEALSFDEGPETALHLFEQHLNRRKVPLRFSRTVEAAIEASLLRLERALSD